MKFFVRPDSKGEWRWRTVARNGRITADSGEGYTRSSDAVRAAEHFQDSILNNSNTTGRLPIIVELPKRRKR